MPRAQITLSTEQARRLDARASAQGRSRADLIGEALDAWLDADPDPFAARAEAFPTLGLRRMSAMSARRQRN